MKLGYIQADSTKLHDMVEISASKKSRWDSCEADFVEFYGPDTVVTKEAKILLNSGARDLAPAVGNLLHKTLEIAARDRLDLYDKAVASCGAPDVLRSLLASKVTQDELLACLEQALKTPDRFGGLYPADEEVTKSCVETLVRAAKLKTVRFDYMAVNRQRRLLLEAEHRVLLGNVGTGAEPVTGHALLYLDRVDERPSGDGGVDIYVVDYKSGHTDITSEEAETDPQVTLYLVAAHDMFPDAKNWYVELNYVATGKKAWAKWSQTLDWWTRATFRETLRRIRTQTMFAERPGWQCRSCFRKSACQTYQAYLRWKAPQVSVDTEDMGKLADEYHDIDTRVSSLRKRQDEIEVRLLDELKLIRRGVTNPWEAELLVSKWAFGYSLRSNRTDYDPPKVWDAWVSAGLDPKNLLRAMNLGKGKLEDLINEIPDPATRKKFAADLDLIGQKNSYRQPSWKELPNAFPAAQEVK